MTTYQNKAHKAEQGFTLIELSIVLVIIGLIVGGVLVGQDLIKAAEVRAQITQIEKYNTAVNTFRVKFNALPGDMSLATATQFGIPTPSGTACNGTSAGQRDGNGLLDGSAGAGSLLQGSAEVALFWSDLSSSAGGNLIDGSFSQASGAVSCVATPTTTASGTGTANTSTYIPAGKLRGTSVWVYNGNATNNNTAAVAAADLVHAAPGATTTSNWAGSGYNWYQVAGTPSITTGVTGNLTAPVTVIQAYNMDKKVDDGVPTTGNVLAALGGAAAVTGANPSSTSGGTSISCYDTVTNTYSITIANGNGGNCALSFRFQ